MMAYINPSYSPTRKYDPNSLNKRTGTICSQRVSEETKERVRLESVKIAEESKKFKVRFCKSLERKFEAKIQRIEQNRMNQVEEWRVKTARNPLRPNQYELEMKRQGIQSARMARENHESSRKNLVDSLTGHVNIFHDICPPDKIKSLPIEEKHAMEFRRSKLESRILKKEQVILRNMEYEDIIDFSAEDRFTFS